MGLIDQIVKVMTEEKGVFHVDEITAKFLNFFPHTQFNSDEMLKKISSALAADLRKRPISKCKFLKAKNQKGLTKGFYKLKHKPKVIPPIASAPKVTSLYTGKAGESAVISELLFYGYNASAMAVDDGIDVIAGKDNKYFHIQVKTANVSTSASYGYKIKKSSFIAKDMGQTFYIFVLRRYIKGRYINDYSIIPSNQIRRYIESGHIKDADHYSVTIKIDDKGKYILNKVADVTASINVFSHIT